MPYLQIVEGVGQGSRLPLDGALTVGRAPSNSFCLPDSRASRHHAALTQENGTFVLQDLGSANGTFVNRNRLQPKTPHPLENGDEIQICGLRAVFHLFDTPVAARPGAQRLSTSASPSLSMILTAEDGAPAAVNASLDASVSVIDIGDEEKESKESLLEVVRRLQAMVKVSAELGDLVSRSELLDRIMGSIFKVFPQADRAFIMLRDKKTGELEPTIGAVRDPQVGGQDEFPISRTIISTVVTEKRSILSSDAMQDDRFSAQQSIVALSIRALMCVPFIYKDEILGVINVDTKNCMETFDADDLAMLTGIAGQAAIALKNQELLVDVERETKTRAQLARYISPDVAEGVMSGSIPLQLGAEKKHGTVFFCDIVGFTAMSEKMTATDVVEKLNRYFCVTTEIVTRNRGTLHKFGGDMIMAFWNVMLPDDNAEYNAVRSSLEMQTAVWAFDQDLLREQQAPLFLGIGINTGDFAGGNIGGEDRIEYTIIGDNVNLGQRIESLAGRWQIFVSDSTYEPIRDLCIAVALPPVLVKGKDQPIQIYSVRGLQVGPGEITLDIPVQILSGGGEEPFPGMLTAVVSTGPGPVLELSTARNLEPKSQCRLMFSLPELRQTLTVTGFVDQTSESQAGGSASYSRARLGKLQGAESVLQFLRPGSCLPSERTWDQMKRQ